MPTPASIELQLLNTIAQGDRAAFKQFYELFNRRVYNTVLSYLQNTSEAEEITQDVFVELFHSAHQFKGDSAVSSWVYRIAINKSLDQLRYRHRKKRFGFITSLFGEQAELKTDVPHFEHPGAVLENREKSTVLFRAIDQLGEQQKTAFILSQIEELPQKQIATVMNVSEKAVESLLQRAKSNLRKHLEKFYPERRKT